MLRQNYPFVRFIQSCKNLGFAKGNNLAFQSSRGRNLLFLNPDTEIKGKAIHEMYIQLESLPKVGVVGPKLLNTDRTIQTTCIRAFPGIMNQMLESDVLRRWFPRSRFWGAELLFAEGERPKKVDAVSGASLMIKRSVFEKVERFSPDYYMYSEDVDLCFKVREAGWETQYIPKAIVVHHGGSSSSQSKSNLLSSVMMLESRWRFFRKTRSLWYCGLYRIAISISILVRMAVLAVMCPALSMHVRSPRFRSALRKWSARLRWAMGGERWVKDF